MADIATVVLPNGQVLQFRQRDADFPRFKVYGTDDHIEVFKLFKEQHPDIDLDDCDGMQLGWWITALWKDVR